MVTASPWDSMTAWLNDAIRLQHIIRRTIDPTATHIMLTADEGQFLHDIIRNVSEPDYSILRAAIGRGHSEISFTLEEIVVLQRVARNQNISKHTSEVQNALNVLWTSGAEVEDIIDELLEYLWSSLGPATAKHQGNRVPTRMH